jgi:hypothetical protein
MPNAALLRSQVQAALPRLEIPLGLAPQPVRECLPTGIPAIDALTRGGIPRGAMTEIAGEPSSGRTTVFLSLLAQATRRGEYCALIDAHDAFDPRTAEHCGAILSRLLWIRCGGNVEHALNAADRMVHAGGFGIVAFDLADADLFSVRRISLASWFRLRHAIGKTTSALVVVSRHFNARSCSHLQLEMRRTGATWSGHLLRSLNFEAETRKHQMARRAAFETQRFDPLG